MVLFPGSGGAGGPIQALSVGSAGRVGPSHLKGVAFLGVGTFELDRLEVEALLCDFGDLQDLVGGAVEFVGGQGG